MSIQRTHKQSNLEKRLKLLELQLHGKKPVEHIKYNVLSSKEEKNKISTFATNHQPPLSYYSDVTYLKTDLFKIFILSTIAISAELIIYLSSRNNLLRIF